MECKVYSEERESYHNTYIIYTAGNTVKTYAQFPSPSVNSVKREKFWFSPQGSSLLPTTYLGYHSREEFKDLTDILGRDKRCKHTKTTGGKSGNPECEQELTLFVEEHDASLSHYRWNNT